MADKIGGLKLTRKAGSRFYITHPDGSEIVVEVDTKCGVLIDAPPQMKILRGEVRERLRAS